MFSARWTSLLCNTSVLFFIFVYPVGPSFLQYDIRHTVHPYAILDPQQSHRKAPHCPFLSCACWMQKIRGENGILSRPTAMELTAHVLNHSTGQGTSSPSSLDNWRSRLHVTCVTNRSLPIELLSRQLASPARMILPLARLFQCRAGPPAGRFPGPIIRRRLDTLHRNEKYKDANWIGRTHVAPLREHYETTWEWDDVYSYILNHTGTFRPFWPTVILIALCALLDFFFCRQRNQPSSRSRPVGPRTTSSSASVKARNGTQEPNHSRWTIHDLWRIIRRRLQRSSRSQKRVLKREKI